MSPSEVEAQLVVIRALMEGGTTDQAALLALEADLINQQGVAA